MLSGAGMGLWERICRGVIDIRTKIEHCSRYVLNNGRRDTMLKVLIEEAAALASITLFIGMVAIWAQVFTTL